MFVDLVTAPGFKPGETSEKRSGGFDSHPLPLSGLDRSFVHPCTVSYLAAQSRVRTILGLDAEIRFASLYAKIGTGLRRFFGRPSGCFQDVVDAVLRGRGKYAWINEHRDLFSVTLLCRTLDVNASGYLQAVEGRARLESSMVSSNPHINQAGLRRVARDLWQL